MNKKSSSEAFKLMPKNESPFGQINREEYEAAQILCVGLKSFAAQLAPLLRGKYLIVCPDGQIKAADLVIVQSSDVTPKAVGNA